MPQRCRYPLLVGRLSTFKRGFASTLGFNLMGRGMSALTLVVLLRALDTPNFAFVVLLMSVGAVPRQRRHGRYPPALRPARGGAGIEG